MRLPGFIFLAAMALVFLGERTFGDGSLHWPLTLIGLGLLVGCLGLRARLVTTADETRNKAEKAALVWTVVSIGGLVLYLLTTEAVVDLLGFDEDAAARWSGVWSALVPIVWLLGALPALLLDRALHQHPMVLPAGSAKYAVYAGVTTALALALVFPVNHLALNHEKEWDFAYFRTTRPGGSTLALARSLGEPVTAYLFFAPASEVKEEVLPYFDALAVESGGLLSVEVVDQPLVPELSEELKIRENGYIALQQGDASEKFKVGTDIDRARRELKKLDSTVQKNLLKIARGQRTAYLMTGHGEASPRERDDPLRKTNLFKKLLQSQNYKVESFGLTEGSADVVPDDAALVIVAGPEKELLPEEQQALVDYLGRGGSVLVSIDPGMARLEGLLAQLGLQAGDHPLAHATAYVPRTRGPADRVLLVTNRFGSHESVKTLSRNSTQLAVFMPTVAPLLEQDVEGVNTSALIRSMPDTWVDVDGDREQGEDEAGAVHTVAYAATGGEGDQAWRAIVLGDVSVFSDAVFQISIGNQQLAYDAVRWLVGDEELAGDVSSEEDVKIQHTRDQDVKWFYGTIFAVPLLVVIAGLLFTRIRRRSK